MNRIYSLKLIGVLVLSLLLGGCSGGGGGDPIEDSYTVGGTVTGLAGSGLVLQNNGGDNLPISADGSFTFDTHITDGSSYVVTVLTQPNTPNQICTVTNASGTVSGGNVTNISVSCVNAYTIGGTVTGLSGSSLVLQNNSGDDLAISTDGSFSFATTIADGSSYAVTVFNQPVSPTQTCMLSDASGTLSGSDVTTVKLTCSKVSPLYSNNGFFWNDYVKGDDITNAIDTACNADVDTSCLHGGENRVVELDGISSCTGITATDALGVFDWICDESTGAARVISTGLASGYGLADLLDFSTPSWKSNSVTVYQGASAIETTTPVNWWPNPVVANTSGGSLVTAGTVYVVPANTSVAYSLGADRVSLVAAPSVVMAGPAIGSGSYVISTAATEFLWLEGMTIDAAGDDGGVYWNTVRFSVMRDLRSENVDTGTSRNGITLVSSSFNTLMDISANNNGRYGIGFWSSSNNTLFNINADNNDLTGIHIDYNSDSNILSDLTTNNSVEYGLLLSRSLNNLVSSVSANNNAMGVVVSSSNNIVSNVTASSNGYGVYVASATDNMLSNITVSNNDQDGIYVNTSNNNVLSALTANNNGQGVYIEDSSYISLIDVAASNNGTGLAIARSSNNSILNITASNNSVGVTLHDTSENYFTGEFQVGQATNCSVTNTATITNPGLDDDNDPSDQGNDAVHDGLCVQEGASDFDTATIGISLAASFVGKIPLDDTINISDINGAATMTDALAFDWTSFENTYRAWGVDGSTFPDVTNRGELGCSDKMYTNQTDCEANLSTWKGNAHIWDWSLWASDTAVKNSVSLPTGSDTLTHTWSDMSTTTFLRNAVEIKGDNIGNDNTLCETGETCLYTPNTGAYQGHGNLLSAGTFIDGTITGVTLMKYENNGY